MSGPRLELIAPHNEPVIVFRRAFQGSASLVFEAWTEPEHLRHWHVRRFASGVLVLIYTPKLKALTS